MPLDSVQLIHLIQTQAGSLQVWIRSRCRSAEDVVQEAFCRLAKEHPEPENPVAWLYRVCRNLAESERLSEERRKQRETSHALTSSVEKQPFDNMVMQETLAAVEKLPADLQEVLIARIWGRLSLVEVGSLCGISAATAFRRYESALKELRKKLEVTSETST